VQELIIDSTIQINTKCGQAALAVLDILNTGKSAVICVYELEENKEPKRTLPQNNLSFLVYTRIGSVIHGGDTLAARCEAKLRIGVPILRRDDTRFREVYDTILKPLTYEQKIAVMEYFPVTSIMSKKQKTEYMGQVLNDYTLKGCYFGDINGTDGYMLYREAQQ